MSGVPKNRAPVLANAQLLELAPGDVMIPERIGFLHEDKAAALGRLMAVDGQRDVRLEQRNAHFAHGVADVLLLERAAPAQRALAHAGELPASSSRSSQSSRKQPEAARSRQEQPGAARGSQKLPEAARSS